MVDPGAARREKNLIAVRAYRQTEAGKASIARQIEARRQRRLAAKQG